MSGNHPLYSTWWHMVRRCTNPKAINYHNYGGRGIRVCERWRNDFYAFVADMEPRPYGMTLDRIDNSGNYEPANCRWATKHEQNRNTKLNVFFTVNGERLCQKDWVLRLRSAKTTLLRRTRKYGIEATERWIAKTMEKRGIAP